MASYQNNGRALFLNYNLFKPTLTCHWNPKQSVARHFDEGEISRISNRLNDILKSSIGIAFHLTITQIKK